MTDLVRGWRRVRGSVRLRVTLLAAGAFAVTMLVAAVLLVRALEGALVGDVRVAARQALAEQAERLLDDGIPNDAVMVRIGDVTAARWPGADGQDFLVALPPGVEPGQYFTRELQAIGSGSTVAIGSATVADSLGYAGVPGSYIYSARPVGAALLSTVSPLDEVRATIDRTRQLLWIVGPALVALVAGLSWLLASRALRPVRQMTARVAAIESSSLHERVPEPGRALDRDQSPPRRRCLARATHAGRRDAYGAGGGQARRRERLGGDERRLARRARPVAGARRRPVAAGSR
jgi:hypothetical protein